MGNYGKRFEKVVLLPIQIIFIVSVVFFVINGEWLWILGSLAGMFYLGIIGQKLHPLQSAREMSEALDITTLDFMPEALQRRIVSHSCTRVGILMGISTGVVLFGMLGWRWYFAFIFGLFAMTVTAILLKVAFE